MEKAVIYARYSSDSQNEQSIEGQLRVCQTFAKEMELFVVDTYIDRAMTGTNDNRVAFQQMLKDSAKGLFDVLIVYKLDRFARNQYESTVNRHLLRQNNVKVLSAMERIPDTIEGDLMTTIMEGFNQYFSQELRQKVHRGIRESHLKGNSTGGNCPYGYRVVNQKYEIVEEEAAVIREVFEKYAKGYKATAIMDSLNNRGVRKRNGKPMDKDYLYYILHYEKYTGRATYHGETFTNIFPRIITDAVWTIVAGITEENKIAPNRKKETYGYILSGKAICGCCRKPLQGESGGGRNGVHYYYICPDNRKRAHTCETKALKKHEFEDAVVAVTKELLADTDCIHRIAQDVYAIYQKECVDDTTLNLLKKQRAEKQKALNNILNAIEQGITTASTKQRLVEIETSIEQLDFDIEQENLRHHGTMTAEDVEAYIRQFMSADWDDQEIRKAIISTFIREIVVTNERIIITYNFTDDIVKPNRSASHIADLNKKCDTAFSSIRGTTNLASWAPPSNLATEGCLVVRRPLGKERTDFSLKAVKSCPLAHLYRRDRPKRTNSAAF